MLYDNKLCTGDEAAECRKCLDARIRKASAMRSSQTAVITGNFKRQEKNFGKRKKRSLAELEKYGTGNVSAAGYPKHGSFLIMGI